MKFACWKIFEFLVIHQLKNRDFQGRLAAKLKKLDKNWYEIRVLRKKLSKKTFLSE